MASRHAVSRLKHDGAASRSSAAIAIESIGGAADDTARTERPRTDPLSVSLLLAALACSAALGYAFGTAEPAGAALGFARVASAAPAPLDGVSEPPVRAAHPRVDDTAIERLRLRRVGVRVEGPVERRAGAAPADEALVPVIGRMQAEVLRLRVLFKRLAAVAELDDGEFDLELEPHELPEVRRALEHGGAAGARAGGRAAGAETMSHLSGGAGPAPGARDVAARADESLVDVPPSGAPSDAALAALDLSIRALAPISRQSARMARIFDARRGAHDRRVGGRVAAGTVRSSGFGFRANPFGGGRRELHRGVDFAGPPGTPIRALADGVVTWSGANGGYGNLVELEHADGFRTRYAHNMSNLVALGERVEKGQAIALLGSSGRSSGPHVHVEVREHGAPLDPARFVR